MDGSRAVVKLRLSVVVSSLGNDVSAGVTVEFYEIGYAVWRNRYMRAAKCEVDAIHRSRWTAP